MTGDYPPELVRAWIIRFGSIEQAEAEARTRPGFGDEIRKIESQQSALLNLADLGGDSGRELEERRRRLVVAALTEDKEEPERDDPRRGPRPDAVTAGWPRDPLDKIVELRATRGWGKHTIAGQDGIEGRVSVRQVGYIIKRVDSGALIWDVEHRRTRTGPGFDLKPGPAPGTVVLVSR